MKGNGSQRQDKGQQIQREPEICQPQHVQLAQLYPESWVGVESVLGDPAKLSKKTDTKQAEKGTRRELNSSPPDLNETDFPD